MCPMNLVPERWLLMVFLLLLSLLSTGTTSQSAETSTANMVTSGPTAATSSLQRNSVTAANNHTVDCQSLLPGQYLCDEFPIIDNRTQQPKNCQKETGKAPKALR